jgi:eukaryotic-like serine/threonine-protein kinase
MVQPPSKNFGRYEFLERVAAGGMAEVFRAKMKGAAGFERTIAVKRILPGYSQDRDFVAMFIDEAKIACELSHGNIVQIYDLGEVDGRYFIAMEYIDGKDVRHLMEAVGEASKPGKLPPEIAAFIIAEACAGLDYAHRKLDPSGKPMGIVHRDISPSNILLSFEGEVKLGDFGIAKAFEKLNKTRTGTIKGKYNYLAPEAVRGLGVDHRSDVFGMGTVLYEMLTSKKVFEAKSELRILEMVRSGDYIPARQLEPSIPLAVERIINKALMRDREKRYQSAAELEYDLHGFLYSLGRRTSGAELAAFMRNAFGRAMPNQQGIAHIPAVPVSLPVPFRDMEETQDQDSMISENTSVGGGGLREEKTSMINIGSTEGPNLVMSRDQRTDIFANPLSKELINPSEELQSQPTQIRSSPEDPLELDDEEIAEWVPFSQWNNRQRIEAAAAVLLATLWISIGLINR